MAARDVATYARRMCPIRHTWPRFFFEPGHDKSQQLQVRLSLASARPLVGRVTKAAWQLHVISKRLPWDTKLDSSSPRNMCSEEMFDRKLSSRCAYSQRVPRIIIGYVNLDQLL